MCIEFDTKKNRDLFLIESNKSGVMTRPTWELMHTLPMYQKCISDEQKNAIHLQERIVNIPSSYRNNK